MYVKVTGLIGNHVEAVLFANSSEFFNVANVRIYMGYSFRDVNNNIIDMPPLDLSHEFRQNGEFTDAAPLPLPLMNVANIKDVIVKMWAGFPSATSTVLSSTGWISLGKVITDSSGTTVLPKSIKEIRLTTIELLPHGISNVLANSDMLLGPISNVLPTGWIITDISQDGNDIVIQVKESGTLGISLSAILGAIQGILAILGVIITVMSITDIITGNQEEKKILSQSETVNGIVNNPDLTFEQKAELLGLYNQGIKDITDDGDKPDFFENAQNIILLVIILLVIVAIIPVIARK